MKKYVSCLNCQESKRSRVASRRSVVWCCLGTWVSGYANQPLGLIQLASTYVKVSPLGICVCPITSHALKVYYIKSLIVWDAVPMYCESVGYHIWCTPEPTYVCMYVTLARRQRFPGDERWLLRRIACNAVFMYHASIVTLTLPSVYRDTPSFPKTRISVDSAHLKILFEWCSLFVVESTPNVFSILPLILFF